MKSDNVGMVVLVVIGMFIVLAACGPGGGGGTVSSPQHSVPAQSNSYQAEDRAQQQRDDMIRRVNGILANIGNAEDRLQDMQKSIHDEQKALDKLKENARTAHLGGQLNDFRVWQRIGREKKANIEICLKKAENTITEARQGAESELQRVNWVSDGDKNSHVSQVNQRLAALENSATTLGQASSALARHATWIDANE